MKLIGITKSDLEQIKAHRAVLATTLKGATGKQSQFESLLEKQSTLQAEIAALEKENPTEKAVQSLTTKRTELELVSRRLDEMQPLDPTTEVKFQALQREAKLILDRVLSPTYNDYLMPIISALRPFSVSEAHARKLASETNAAKYLAARLFNDYAHPVVSNGARMAAVILKRYDEVLAGEIKWQFDPKLS